MAVRFVIKKFYKNGTSEYFEARSQFGDMFTSNIFLAWLFESYENAENKISTSEGLFQIEKVFLQD